MSDRFDAVRALVEGGVGSAYPAARLVVADDGEPVLDLVAGACQRDTPFDVASLTKPLVTTTLAMRLVDDGALALDDLLRPEVTVRHGLAHATGLPAWKPLHALVAGNPDPKEAATRLVRAMALDAPPGSRSVYSDLGMILVGDAVERAGEAPLDEQWRAVAEELGVGATFNPPPSVAQRCAPTLADPALRGRVNDDNARAMGGVAGHAGLFATAGDVSTVAAALVAAWRGETASPVARPETVHRFWRDAGVPGSTWCLGWDRPSVAGSSAGERWPRDGVGHLAFTGCSLWIDPSLARWVVLLTNRVLSFPDNAGLKALRPALHDAVVAALERR